VNVHIAKLLILASLAATFVGAPENAAGNGADALSEVTIKAAFLYNFAKFTEWPALQPAGIIIVCVVGNDRIASTLVETVRGQKINGHALEVQRPQDTTTWRSCHVLFVADAEARQLASGLGEIGTLPVLTVSDGKGFCEGTGIVELYVENERMRFAINVDAAERSGLRLSSRLLALAKVIRTPQVQ
jgi:YfiR/HmsC-like